MRLRNIPRSEEVLANSPYVVQDPAAAKGKWRELFKEQDEENKKLLNLEVGTGKGRFILELAARHPEQLYVGLEKFSSVLLRVAERQQELMLPNLLLIRGEAELLTTYFAQGETDRIYLNFSDPWPKARHAKRRLPSKEFLARYDEILSPDGVIEFKTDNRELFDFAVEEVPSSPFEIVQITYDLHHDEAMNEGNIMTEYEERFS
ncbi:MAG: tRNA (guanosine(46)-N7)-methyltransferase TrmB, partial [Lachnospiraceae bacterium]|nr:tRNA (guanosine(46)-N7)-methyltransferase TrmB [Lachnospiraceae bacterium]